MPEKILFVDDDPSVLDGYKRALRGAFSADTATGGHEALQAEPDSNLLFHELPG